MENKPNAIQKLLWKSSTIVYLSGLLVGLAMIFQGFALTQAANGTVSGVMLPHQALTWAFAVIASGYAGTDRIAQFVKTKSMSYGNVDLGDPAKLRKLIGVTVVLLLIGIVLSSFFGVPGLALDALATAFGGCAAAYVIGNKSLRAAASTEGTHDAKEQPQYHMGGGLDGGGK